MRHIVERDNTKQRAPLSEPVLLILLSMAEEPRHGYAILKDVEEMSRGRIQLATGTLYGALRRMLDDLWIERHEERDAPRERTAYRLTAIGRRVLVSEVARVKMLAAVASLRISDQELAPAMAEVA